MMLQVQPAHLQPSDKLLIEDLFEMGGGYVLDFSDRSMARFFAEQLNLDIDHPRYKAKGTSKANRLRSLIAQADAAMLTRVLRELWAYRSAMLARCGKADPVPNAEGRFLDMLNGLEGSTFAPPPAQPLPPPAGPDRTKVLRLMGKLEAMKSMPPQARGYAFESFLTSLFDAHGLEARSPFVLRGEQIDGSFQMAGETYLVEAKWQEAKTPAADLHVFEGKLGQKAAWARGLFVSYTGFSDDGLFAYGRATRIICMDGADMAEMFRRHLPLNRVLERKVRGAAETGSPLMRLGELFPNSFHE